MLHEDRSELKNGRLTMTIEEATLLFTVCLSAGDHVEIGTLWGATAIIAASRKREPWRVYSIDIMRHGFWTNGDPGAPDNARPTVQAIRENLAHAEVADKVVLVRASSNPFPLVNLAPMTALIDGAHDYDSVVIDWTNVSAITSRFVALHDYEEKHSGVYRAINDVVLKDPNWRKYEQAGTLVVMEKKA